MLQDLQGTKKQDMTQARPKAPKAMVSRVSRMSRMLHMSNMSNMSNMSMVSMDTPCHQLKVLHGGRPCLITRDSQNDRSETGAFMILETQPTSTLE